MTRDRKAIDALLSAHWTAPGDLIAAAAAMLEPEGADPAVLARAAERARSLGSDASRADLAAIGALAVSAADLAADLASGRLPPLGPAGTVLGGAGRALEDALVLLEAGDSPDDASLATIADRATRARGASVPAAPMPVIQAPASPPPAASSPADPSQDPASTPAADFPVDHWGPWAPAYPDMEGDYLEEIQSHVDKLQAGLVTLTRGTAPEGLINDLFRSSHSIKGQSGQMSVQPLERVAHKLEDVLDAVRSGKLLVTTARAEALLAVIDTLASMMEALRSTRMIDHPVGREIALMERILRGEDPAGATPPTHVPAAVSAPPAEQPRPATPAPATQPEPAVQAPPARQPQPAAPAPAAAAQPATQYLRVDFAKVDQVMNLVGDLFLNKIKLHEEVHALDRIQFESTRLQALLARRKSPEGEGLKLTDEEARALASGLSQIEAGLESLCERLSLATGETDMISSDLRDQVMVMRMVPLDSILGRLGRVVFDALQKECRGKATGWKQARLDVKGAGEEIDKVIANMLEVPLVHIVRNSVGHGIESAEERVAAGKPAEGTITVKAGQEGNHFLIEVTDDGRGIDPKVVARAALKKDMATQAQIDAMSERELLSLIFKPGFTTAEQADDLKGRGVGLDEVLTKISAIKGSIDVKSVPGRGTTVTLSLPLTLAITTVLIAEVGDETMALPLSSVERVVKVPQAEIERLGAAEVFTLQGTTVPVLRADEVLAMGRPSASRPDEYYVPILKVGDKRFGLAMDRMTGKQDVVVKSLGTLLSDVPLVAGATLIGERCILILDPIDIAARLGRRPPEAAAPIQDAGSARQAARPRLLLVEDDRTTRLALRKIFEEGGCEVYEAEDGVKGLELASSGLYNVVSTDVIMPRMDGYELTRRIRGLPQYKNVPIIMITSKSAEVDKRAGFDAGVDHYVAKPFERRQILDLLKEVLG